MPISHYLESVTRGTVWPNPAGTIRWPNVDQMLQHWINIGPTCCACWELRELWFSVEYHICEFVLYQRVPVCTKGVVYHCTNADTTR